MARDRSNARNSRPLLELLLNHLPAALGWLWPGADGLTVDDALGCYRAAAASGCVPGLNQLLRDHPQWNQDLVTFFGKPADPREGKSKR